MRLFLAVHPPPERVSEFIGLLPQGLPAHRTVPMEQVHCTVMFIGERDRRQLDASIESAAATCAGVRAFAMRPIRLSALPERGPKRTLVVECDRPRELLEIHDRAVQRFARDPAPHSRDRFLPHLTVGRFPGAGTPLPAGCGVPRELAAGDESRSFAIAHISLMSSTLRADGARHSVVATFPLILK